MSKYHDELTEQLDDKSEADALLLRAANHLVNLLTKMERRNPDKFKGSQKLRLIHEIQTHLGKQLL